MNQRQMHCCEENSVRPTLHIDNELDDAEKRAFETHLKECTACREAFNRERWFLESVRRTRPLYVASDELRNRVAAIVDVPVSPHSPAPSQPRRRWVSSRVSALRLVANRYAAAVTLILLTLAGLWSVEATLRTSQTTTTFATMAVDAHQRYLLGQLPLDLATDEPEKISKWFEGKVPFSVKLPNYAQPLGKEKLYRLEGARLVGFKGDYAAYVAYQMGRHPISLVVTSSTVAEPSGGETIASKGLIFHHEAIAGFKVITWIHRGLTYSLVSDLEVGGQQSCLVCHQPERDQNFIKNLSL